MKNLKKSFTSKAAIQAMTLTKKEIIEMLSDIYDISSDTTISDKDAQLAAECYFEDYGSFSHGDSVNGFANTDFTGRCSKKLLKLIEAQYFNKQKIYEKPTVL